MNIKFFHNEIFCHCYSQNTADVKILILRCPKEIHEKFKYNGILSLKDQNGSLMKDRKQQQQKTSSLFYAKALF